MVAVPRGCIYIGRVGDQHGGNTPTIRNRKAFHDYHILDRWEAGIALTGSEVKSLRAGKANLRDAYGRIKDGEIYLRVPAQRGGQGRVHVDVQGRRVECKAMTEGPELLPGVAVTVVGLVTANVLLVESA